MRLRAILACLVLVIMFGVPISAEAQPTCPCNCYFSGDCPGGQFCNWGSLPVEDTCFWRTPKPQGVPGAGCTQDYNNWGQCDGICDGGGGSIFDGEDISSLEHTVKTWALAIDTAADSGEGFADATTVQQLGAVPLKNPTVVIAAGRVVIETMMYARGVDFAVMPEGRTVFAGDVAVQPDTSDAAAQASRLLVKILLSEIRTPGSGENYLDALSKVELNGEVVGLVCADQADQASCVYQRIRVMGNTIGGTNQAGARGIPTCGDPNMGDIDNDGDVDHKDIVALVSILMGGPTDPSWIIERADTNEDGVYDGRDIPGFVVVAMS